MCNSSSSDRTMCWDRKGVTTGITLGSILMRSINHGLLGGRCHGANVRQNAHDRILLVSEDTRRARGSGVVIFSYFFLLHA